jgi:hypothetical protein
VAATGYTPAAQVGEAAEAPLMPSHPPKRMGRTKTKTRWWCLRVALSAEQRFALRQRVSARLLAKLHHYLLELQREVLPKSPSGAAVRFALNQWGALTRFIEDGDLEIDNGDLAAACDSFLQQISLTVGVIQLAAVQNDACPNGKPPSGSSGGR